MLRGKSRDYLANTLHQVQLQSVDLVFLWSVLLSAFESDAEFFGCYCTETCCVSSVKGAIWVCRLLTVHSSFINKERFVWLQWHNFNQLPAGSTLLFPGCLKDAVGFSSPTEQLWFLSFLLTDAATLRVSSSPREISDEQRNAEELQKQFSSVWCAWFILDPVFLSGWCVDK